jgi:hypothetical protein
MVYHVVKDRNNFTSLYLTWAFFFLQHMVLYYKYPVEVDLDETRQMATVISSDTVGFGKYRTLHDYKTVSMPSTTHPSPDHYCLSVELG